SLPVRSGMEIATFPPVPRGAVRERGREGLMKWTTNTGEEQTVRVATGRVTLEGNLDVPAQRRGVVLFAHGSGSSRHSSRNRFVAQALREAGLATLLLDPLTAEEESVDVYTGHLRF